MFIRWCQSTDLDPSVDRWTGLKRLHPERAVVQDGISSIL